MNTDEIKQFLAKANRAGYGNPNTKEDTDSDQSHTITFFEGDWSFHDNYFGGEPFGGREVIHFKGKPIWMMVYYGGIVDTSTDASEVYRFLKGALLQFPHEMPLRGPEHMEDGEWKYTNTVTGLFDRFVGEEVIHYQGAEVYRTKYQGGLVDR